MNPIKFLQSLLKLNRPATILIMTGLGVFAAATLVVSWIGSIQNFIVLGVCVLGFGVVASILTYIVNNPLMKTVLGWMFVINFGLIMALALDSISRFSGRIAPPTCFRTIFVEPISACNEKFIDGHNDNSVVVAAPQEMEKLELAMEIPELAMEIPELAMEIPELTMGETKPAMMIFEPAPMVPIIGTTTTQLPASTSVSDVPDPLTNIHFVLDFGREAAKTIAENMTKLGWDIEGGENGGKLVKRGPSAPQIRYYSTEYAKIAKEMAQDLSKQLGGADVIVNDFSKAGLLARPNLLEIWLTNSKR